MFKDILKLLFVGFVLIAMILMISYVYTVATANDRPDETAAPSDHRNTGTTAQCVDGMYSYSTNHAGTCAGHGGVKEWYK